MRVAQTKQDIKDVVFFVFAFSPIIIGGLLSDNLFVYDVAVLITLFMLSVYVLFTLNFHHSWAKGIQLGAKTNGKNKEKSIYRI